MLPAMHIITPGGREYWADVKPAFGTDVVDAIDKILEDNPPQVETLYQIFPYFRPDSDATLTQNTPSPQKEPYPEAGG